PARSSTPCPLTDSSSHGPFGAPLLGALMRMPVVEIGRRMLASLHEQGFDDLIPAHLIVLRWHGPDGKRPVEVAEQTGMSKQALNYLLGQLEEAGYLERVEDPDDRRSKRIRTTKRGGGAGRAAGAAERESGGAGEGGG